MTCSITTLSIMCRDAECRDYFNAMLSVVRMNVVQPLQPSLIFVGEGNSREQSLKKDDQLFA
jgi:hypothetical protein